MQLFFDIIDYDKNGFVEKDDFISIGENICAMLQLDEENFYYPLIYAACEKAWEDLYAYVDEDEDGRASSGEWFKYADEKIVNCDKSQYQLYLDKVVQHIFELFDQNKDDFISVNEYINLFMSFRLEIRYSAKAFTKLDLNKDSLISREELYTGVEQFFRSNDPSDKGNWLFGSLEDMKV
ncbi:EF-hand domain-containing protein [Marinoscillum sp. MHG1-6]|uniref:EF-hand domain-containing protein n=1 Tax=Marinoscillum sp. MHG1-6 TaxID=2959627 RepID=UPI0021589EA6|nr:EF-hand domain-containing protein [Marinoscillum sp. MHG1-6]